MQLTIDVCPKCGHAIDARDNPSQLRACFGKIDAPHARRKRVRVVVDVDLDRRA